jgi:hypothetical protein
MERATGTSSYDPDFREEIEDLYIERVAPALLEIKERVSGDAYLRELGSAASTNMPPLMTAAMTIAVATGVGLQSLVHAAIEAAFAAAPIVATAAHQYTERKDAAAHHQLFFLHRTQELLR